MPKVFLTEKQKDISRLYENLKLIQGATSNDDMGVIIGGSKRTYERRVKNPESLTYQEIKRLCDHFHIDIAAFCSSKLKIQ